MTRLPEWATARRKNLGLSMRKLAKDSRVDVGTISTMEAGKHMPLADTLSKLAPCYRVPVGELVRMLEDPEYWIDPAVSAGGRFAVEFPADVWEALSSAASRLGIDPRDLAISLVRRHTMLPSGQVGTAKSPAQRGRVQIREIGNNQSTLPAASGQQ